MKIPLWQGMLLVILPTLVTAACGPVPRDDSDASTVVRSGMTPRTDHLTGCQYLTGGGGITPRMGADGKQICEKKP